MKDKQNDKQLELPDNSKLVRRQFHAKKTGNKKHLQSINTTEMHRKHRQHYAPLTNTPPTLALDSQNPGSQKAYATHS